MAPDSLSPIPADLPSLRKRTAPRECLECAAVFVTEPRRLNDPTRGRFCSRSCQSRYVMARRDTAGAKNPNWKGGVAKVGYRYALRFRAKFPEKYRAQRIAQQAIRVGQIVRPANCSACGVPCKPHGHHDDYRKPLALRWLCRGCHIAHHAAVRRDQSRSWAGKAN